MSVDSTPQAEPGLQPPDILDIDRTEPLGTILLADGRTFTPPPGHTLEEYVAMEADASDPAAPVTVDPDLLAVMRCQDAAIVAWAAEARVIVEHARQHPQDAAAQLARAVVLEDARARRIDIYRPAPGIDIRTASVRELPRFGRSAAALLQDVPPEVDWLIPGVLVRGEVTKLAGREKLGKGTLAFYCIGCLERGAATVFGPEPSEPVTAVILTEEPVESVREKLELSGVTAAHIIEGHELAGMPWPDKVDAVVSTALLVGAGVIFLDNVSRAAGVDDESGQDLARAIAHLSDAVRKAGLACLIDHHHRKARGAVEDMSRGGTGIAGATDINVEMFKVGGPLDRRRRLVSNGRLRATRWERTIALAEDGRSYLDVAATAEQEEGDLVDVVAGGREMLDGLRRRHAALLDPDGSTWWDFGAAINEEGETTIRRVLKGLVEYGLATRSTEKRPSRDGKQRNTSVWRPVNPATEGDYE